MPTVPAILLTVAVVSYFGCSKVSAEGPSSKRSLLSASPLTPPQTPGNCTYSSWSAPVRFDIPAGSFIRWPSLAIRDGQGYVVGNDIPLLDETPVKANPLIALSLSGKTLGRPSGDFSFAFPKAALDSEGVLHVIWSEPDSALLRTGSDWVALSGSQGSLWYSSYSGDTWTPPVKLYEGVDLQWSDVQADMTLDGWDRLHVVVVDYRVSTGELVYLLRTGDTWYHKNIPAHGAVYSAVTIGTDRDIYISYIAPDTTALPDANSVFLIRSQEDGLTWSPPLLISRSGANQAFEVRALGTPDSAIHLVWAQNLSGGMRTEVIRHVFSPDSNHQLWSVPRDLDVEDGFFRLQALTDRCGTMHVVYSTWAPHNRSSDPDDYINELWYARRDTAWTTPTRLFSHLNSLQPALASNTTGDTLILLWSARPAESIGREAFRPRLSRLAFQVDELGDRAASKGDATN